MHGVGITIQDSIEISLANMAEEAYAAALAEAREIATNSPLVVRGVKQVLDFSADKPTAVGLEYVAAWNAAFLASEDLAEAATAFMEKRAPSFKGR